MEQKKKYNPIRKMCNDNVEMRYDDQNFHFYVPYSQKDL